jgi:HD-GYP domain-containing protein (c-di-GMP phosphodiesterase class II)
MTTHRPYRRGLTHEEAIEELIRYAGIQFDPGAVKAFVSLPREILTAHASQLPSVLTEPAAVVTG